MVHYGGAELATSFRTVRANTIKIAEEIPAEKYDFSPAPGSRSIGRTLVHVAVAPGAQLYIHSNRFDDLKEVNFRELLQGFWAEEAKPRNKTEILDLLTISGQAFSSFLEGLPDSFLAERVAMPGPEAITKTRFELLLAPKEHEMHHRGQLMVMERMLGLVPHLTRQFEERLAQGQQVRQ